MTPWLLALLPAVAGALVAVSGLRSRAGLAVTAAGVLAATLALAVEASGAQAALVWSDTLVLTAALPPMAAAVAVLVPAVALPVTVWAALHEEAEGLARLVGLLLAFTGGMLLLVIAADLLTLLMGWELVGALSWALIAHHWREPGNPASGLYAFVVTRFGDLGLFAAAMAAFAGAGTFAYDGLAALPPEAKAVAAWGVLLSAAAKAGQVPFAPWLFRAMAGPTAVSALLHAATMVAAGAYVLIRLHDPFAEVPGWSGAVLGVGLATALAGGVVACLQTHAKKLLAASTSAQYGLMFVAVGAGYPGVALLHLIAHACFKALLFLTAGMAGKRAGGYALDRMGFGAVSPRTAALAGIGALALAGVPPLGAAWTKEQVIAAAGHLSPWLAGAVMLAGALSAAYAARLHLMAWARRDDAPDGPAPARGEVGAVGLLAAATAALSLLWLPPVAEALGVPLPPGKAWETATSLLLVAAGLLAGRLLARRGRIDSPAAHWLGLPALLDHAVARPFARLSAAAGWLDDRVLDALPRGVARIGAAVRRALAAGDRRVVDRGVALTAAFGAWLARMGDRVGEPVSDGLPEGAARLAVLAGGDVRRLQSGLAHHYYTLLVAGAGALVLVLILVS